jgi:hypothetical protein
MGIILKPEDIEPFADIPQDKLEAMIADVEAVAVSVAPCIAKPVRCSTSLRVLSLRLHGLILPRICCGLLRLPR